MKFKVYMKSPDSLEDGIIEAVSREMREKKLSKEEGEKLTKQAETFSEKFFEYSEYLIVAFDTEAGTAVVQKRGG